MCAICGILNFDFAERADESVLRNMTSVLSHRGPDDDGYLIEGQVGLGHRRLSIIDVSGGKQPIYNEDGSVAIVFNGEIYNYRDLAGDLVAAGHIFKTQSDTETILHAYEDYGEDCVQHLRGMFAFAIWDSRKQRLLIARDRLGVKPLYYYLDRRIFAFASEIKALLEVPSIVREVDLESLDVYLALRYVPGPRTIFKNIFCLQPGHVMTLSGTGLRTHHPYWDVDYSKTDAERPREYLEKFRHLLEESVRLRMISEVPLGVFLSGGLDSSAILAKAASQGARRMKTFSIGYEPLRGQSEDANEFEYARLAAKAFDADHHEYHLTPGEFEGFIPQLVWHLDEPLADASCIPLFFISRLAREHITVVLSGEGADEILGGYAIYRRMLALERIYRGVPGMDRLARWMARATPSDKLSRYMLNCGEPIERRYRGVDRGPGFESRRRLIGDVRAHKSEERLQAIFEGYFRRVRHASSLNKMLYVDAKVWLPDDLLNKADKMTMANGLELRVPFLDHKLVEFAAGLPDGAKLRGGRGKALLRKSMQGVLPKPILHRPKKGFPVPLSSWLRGPLRQFARDNLLPPDSACSAYLNGPAVARILQEHENGVDRSQEIWTLLVFEFWQKQFIQNPSRRRCAA